MPDESGAPRKRHKARNFRRGNRKWMGDPLSERRRCAVPTDCRGQRAVLAARTGRGGGRCDGGGARAAFQADADFTAGKAGGRMKYKVMIVEDQTMPRELFELRIQSSEHFETALSIDNASLAEVYCLRFPVDLILMDVVTRNGENGLDAAAKIKRAFPKIKIIIVTSMPEYSYLSRAREIGVESFWYKEEQRESLLDVMERTMAGESVYPDATPELQLGLASSYEFTEREQALLSLLNDNRQLSLNRYCRLSRLSRRTVEYLLAKLIRYDIVETVFDNHKFYFRLKQ